MRCPIGAEKGVDLDYTAKDLTVMAAYTDRQERRLIAVGLDPALNTCDDQSEPASRPHWFVIPRDVEPVWLGDGLRLVDAGDYDRDGHSELLFWFSGYNHDGYVLFADELATRVDYLWHYH